jgi:putative membrane protein
MMETHKSSNQSLITSHLANERTYLAWVRTSFSLITLGFATNKFSQFLIEMHDRGDREIPRRILVGSDRFGLMMVILGGLLLAISAWRYQKIRKDIDSGCFRAHPAFIWFVSFLAVLFGMTAIGLMLES